MARKIIVSCALTGHADTADKNPAVPVTPEQIAASAIDARQAGAAITHIHVRDPGTGKASADPELYRETAERIRDTGSDVIINLTTGPGGGFIPGADDPRVADPRSEFRGPESRVEHVEMIRPEVCSLDVATMNMGPEVAFMNTQAHLTVMAERIRAAGVKPELECFDSGHVRLASHMVETGVIDKPPLFQLCLGISWGAPATVEAMTLMRDLLPEGANWAAFGIAQYEFPMVAAAVLLGGNVRVGLEDNLYLDRGALAPSNAALVERAVEIIANLGYEIATPDEVRDILGLKAA